MQKNELEFRILVLLSDLAKHNLFYRGPLNTLCEWVEIEPDEVAMEAAIMHLKEQGYVFCEKEDSDYFVSIRKKGLKDKQVIETCKKGVYNFGKWNHWI